MRTLDVTAQQAFIEDSDAARKLPSIHSATRENPAAITTTGRNAKAMGTADVSNRRVCPRCESTNTICTFNTLDVESWHCFACRHSFEVGLASVGPQRRATDRRRKTSARTDR